MKATIASTDRIVTIKAIGFEGSTLARVWEGTTEAGVPFTAYIPIIQVHKAQDNAQFEAELTEHKQPTADTLRAIDARMVL